MARIPAIFQAFYDDAGDPLIAGKLFFFESGLATTDPKDTFKDINLTIKNSNPVLLTAAGRMPNIFFNGAAKVIITDNDEEQIAVEDPVTSASASSFGQPWDALTIYSLNQVVTFNDRLYTSIVGNNSNNEPPSSTAQWSEFDLVERYNENQTYNVRDPVIATDFNVYISLVANNLNNEPSASPTKWQPTGTGVGFNPFSDWDMSITYGLAGINIVTASNGLYYVSLQATNTNNDPTSSPTFWTQIDFVKTWNINEAYLTGALVRGTDGYVYVAQQATTDDDPVTDTAETNWGPRTADLIATNATNIGTNDTDITNLQTTKADLLSPTFVGNPTAPTPLIGDNDTSITTSAFVQANINAIETFTTGTSGSSVDNRTGRIWQWGQFTQSDTGGSVPYTFVLPITFPTAARQGWITLGDQVLGGFVNASVEGLGTTSVSGFTVGPTATRTYRILILGD